MFVEIIMNSGSMKNITSIIFACILSLNMYAQSKPDTLWFQFSDRFMANEIFDMNNVDSIEFNKASFKRYKYFDSTGRVTGLSKTYRTDGVYRLDDVERYLAKPEGYANCDFTKETSQWCFQRSMESEHFVCFWEKGLTLKNNSITLDGHTINIKTLLANGEKIWKKYVEDLGFLEPGKSTTDKVKIEMFIVNQTAWRADGSGQNATYTYYDGTTKRTASYQVGLFHCNPWAASAEGGHTAAHEIGHVFQYLVSADLGGSNRGWQWGTGDNGAGGNGWWESCAQWQAYNVYPSTLFTGGYYGQYVANAYKNFLHEDNRYANYLCQYYFCQLYGQDFIGRLWRATKKPEDPVETFKRMNSLSQDDFNKIMFDYACRAATWDIDGIRDRGKNYQNAFSTKLSYVEGTDNTYAVSPSCCPQNYGFNIIQLKGITPGAMVKVDFEGIAGASGYRSVKKDLAGWRYGFVAQKKDGTCVYGEMADAAKGSVSLELPEDTRRAWLVVLGAPSAHFHHEWDDKADNDEQWPYKVAFTGCSAINTSRTYDSFPDDYARRDTTVVIDAELALSSSYSSVVVNYDADAICKALGVSTKQLKSLVSNKQPGTAGTLVFAGVNADSKTFKYNTTTTTSSSTVYGHWFNTSGNVCSYDGSAAIFAELKPSDFNCSVGQYPNRLTRGKTYVIRQAVVYTHTDGKQYKAIMEVHLKIK